MGYTKEQIRQLGICPRKRKGIGILPCEAREVRAVAKELLKSDELWQYWRLLPFEEGYACNQRKAFEDWIRGSVDGLWWDIGRPVFNKDGSWTCPEGGWWPYLRCEFQDVSWLRVGKAIIDMDEVWTTLKNTLEEKIHGYRMCPGMKLYRVMRRIVEIDGKMARANKTNRRSLEKERDKLNGEVLELVKLYPTEATKSAGDREWFDYI